MVLDSTSTCRPLRIPQRITFQSKVSGRKIKHNNLRRNNFLTEKKDTLESLFQRLTPRFGRSMKSHPEISKFHKNYKHLRKNILYKKNIKKKACSIFVFLNTSRFWTPIQNHFGSFFVRFASKMARYFVKLPFFY